MTEPIWFKATPIELAALGAPTLVDHLGIEYTEVGPDYLKARMPVDERTRQPFGLLHGGASVALAETLASIAAAATLDLRRKFCVGLEINANHLRGVRSGWVEGVARPLHIGRTTQVWDVRISDEAGRLTCVSRCTVAIVDRPRDEAGGGPAQTSGATP